jgi:hypothetical protein
MELIFWGIVLVPTFWGVALLLYERFRVVGRARGRRG